MKIVCPFCPLRCTDVEVDIEVDIDRNSNRLAVVAGQCDLAEYRAAQSTNATPGYGLAPFIDAVKAAWRQPRNNGFAKISLGGTFLDVNTARQAIRFAAAVRGFIDVSSSLSEQSFALSRERNGEIAATLGEVKQRADSIVLIGEVQNELPRLVDRFCTTPLESKLERRLLRLSDANLRQSLVAVREALLRHDESNEIANWLRAGQYTAWLSDNASVDYLTAGVINGIIAEQNRERRAVRVSTSETNTFRSVAAWLTGLGGPIDFSANLPRLVDSMFTNACDVRIWVQPFPDSPEPPIDDAKLFIVGAVDKMLAQRATAYVRTAMPGIESAGTTYRGDGTICLPLGSLIDSNLLAADHVFDLLSGSVSSPESQS